MAALVKIIILKTNQWQPCSGGLSCRSGPGGLWPLSYLFPDQHRMSTSSWPSWPPWPWSSWHHHHGRLSSICSLIKIKYQHHHDHHDRHDHDHHDIIIMTILLFGSWKPHNYQHQISTSTPWPWSWLWWSRLIKRDESLLKFKQKVVGWLKQGAKPMDHLLN